VDGSPNASTEALHMIFYSVILESGHLWRRLIPPYQSYPWKLGRLADQRISADVKYQEALAFLKAPKSELDLGFSLRLRSVIEKPEDILPNGVYFSVIEMLTYQKTINVSIEDNFARASSIRAVGRGNSSKTANNCSKHVLCELKSYHVAETMAETIPRPLDLFSVIL
jgi:hypothetical protein